MPRKARKVRVNMKGVTGRILIPEGNYRAAVKDIEVGRSKGADNEMLTWTFNIVSDDPKLNGAPLWYYTVLIEKSLWNLRNLLETLGVDVPDGPMDLNFDEMIGMELVAVVEHEDYEGKPIAKMTEFMPLSGDDGGDSGETVTVTEDALPKLGKEEVAEMDEEELQGVVDKYELDVNLGHKKYRTKKLKRDAVIKALDEEGHLEED